MQSDRPTPSIEEHWSVVLSLPAEQRIDYVLAQCDDEAVRMELLRRLSDSTHTLHTAAPTQKTQPISAGIRMGRYRIVRALGAGGMGQVFEAIDENLNRPVAVKVLPAGRYDDASRMRFRREAESASALNHPNIVTVHEVGREGDVDFIAMERITGQTLHNLVAGRPMPLRKAIEIATQIADAVAAAHEAGIVHRDLKPSNVMVTERGIVKVLDFGLAKQIFGTGGPELSRTGDIVGTAYYMSPEQAEGKPVDARSDIFSFGSLLYEMLTGRIAFQRDSVLTTLTAVTSDEPEPLRNVRPEVPRLLDSVYQKCVRKQPHERWQSLSDVKLILKDLAADLDAGGAREPVTGPVPRTKPRLAWYWIGAGLILAGLAIAFGLQRYWRPPGAVALPILRMVTAEKGLSTAPVLSRDGSLLAFASDRSGQGNLDIWIQQVGGSEPMRLTSDAADESDPSFSPDGARVAFRSEREGGGIYVVPALGGDPVLVAPKGRNPRFSPDGKSIAFWVGREGSLVPGSSRPYLVDFAGGAPREIETGLSWAQYPVWSPDGTSILLYGMGGGTSGSPGLDWWIVPAAGGKGTSVEIRQTVLPLRVRYFPTVLDWYPDRDGTHVVFAPDAGDNSNLWRIALTAQGKPKGAAVRLTNGPGRHVRASFAGSKDGIARLAYADETVNYDVYRLPVHPGTGLPDCELQPVTDRLTPEMNPSLSGDGKHAYYISARMGVWSLIRKDLDTSRERTLYTSSQLIYNARVAPMGSKVFFSTRSADLVAIPANGGAIEKLCAKCGSVTGVSASGDRILFEPSHDEHLMMFDVTTGKQVKLADRGDPHVLLDGGQFSPDGKWVAFQATNNETRASSVYMIPISETLPVPRPQWIRVTEESDLSRDPLFAPSGPFLYFTSEKDGFRCLWARRLNPETRVPLGEAFPVRHFHTSRLALRNRASSGNIIGLSAGGNHLLFALTETTGNIWLEETKGVQ